MKVDDEILRSLVSSLCFTYSGVWTVDTLSNSYDTLFQHFGSAATSSSLSWCFGVKPLFCIFFIVYFYDKTLSYTGSNERKQWMHFSRLCLVITEFFFIDSFTVLSEYPLGYLQGCLSVSYFWQQWSGNQRNLGDQRVLLYRVVFLTVSTRKIQNASL